MVDLVSSISFHSELIVERAVATCRLQITVRPKEAALVNITH